MQTILVFLNYLFNNNYFVLAMDIASFILKTGIFVRLAIHIYTNHKKKLPSLYLLLAIFSGAFIDFGWICILTNRIGIPLATQKYILFINRLGWTFLVLQYHCMVLLLETLLTKKYKSLLRKNILLILCSSLFVIFFTIFPFAAWHLAAKPDRPPIEAIMKHTCSIYLLLFLIPVSLWNIYYHLRSKKIPIILQKQCYTLLYTLVIPYFLSDFINMNPFRTNYFKFVVENQAFSGFSTLILTYLLYFCTQRILNIRFLNLKKSISSVFTDIKFNEYFKEVLGKLSSVKYVYEVPQITQEFLHKALHVNEKKVHILMRPAAEEEHTETAPPELKSFHHTIYTLENTFADPKSQYFAFIKKERILLFDEIDFANFYDQDPFLNNVLAMLASIDCAVLVPIFHKEELLAYLIIYSHARKERLYANSDKDALVVFANYVGSILANIQNNQFEKIIEQNRIMADNLYFKTHQINCLKESIKSCFDRSHVKTVCLFLYKNKEFIPLNQQALQFFDINL
ncbi:MAG TPA: GAF domain-containing protein, partial [Patescibacteria group bacterium]|nr:GAF domain-containing protein [Patescibacteria group bacterium]